MQPKMLLVKGLNKVVPDPGTCEMGPPGAGDGAVGAGQPGSCGVPQPPMCILSFEVTLVTAYCARREKKSATTQALLCSPGYASVTQLRSIRTCFKDEGSKVARPSVKKTLPVPEVTGSTRLLGDFIPTKDDHRKRKLHLRCRLSLTLRVR